MIIRKVNQTDSRYEIISIYLWAMVMEKVC